MSKKFMFLLVAAVTLLLPIQVEADNLLSSHVDLTARKALTHDNGLRIIQNQPTVRINHATPPAGTAAQQDPGAGMKRDAIAKVKAQKPTGDATINEKQKNDALRMAHKPVARPSLRHGAVLRSDGEVRDADGVIIKPADGVRKVYNRSGRALFFDPDSDSWLETEQSGTSDVVICDDGTVYMRDIISTYRNGAWMKGTLSGNTISIPVGQLVNYESSFGVPYAVYWGQRDGRDYFKNEPPEKKEQRIEKIRQYHQTIHRKRNTENRAKVARAEIKNVIATLQYIIGETSTPPSDTPTENNE